MPLGTSPWYLSPRQAVGRGLARSLTLNIAKQLAQMTNFISTSLLRPPPHLEVSQRISAVNKAIAFMSEVATRHLVHILRAVTDTLL